MLNRWVEFKVVYICGSKWFKKFKKKVWLSIAFALIKFFIRFVFKYFGQDLDQLKKFVIILETECNI